LKLPPPSLNGDALHDYEVQGSYQAGGYLAFTASLALPFAAEGEGFGLFGSRAGGLFVDDSPVSLGGGGRSGPIDVAAMNTRLENGATVSHSATATAIGDDAATLENFARSRGVAGHDVIVHGARDAAGDVQFVVNGYFTHAQQIADAILANPSYSGGAINLVTCYGACGPAQELGAILDVEVNALPLKVDLHPFTGALRGH
jgi:hypothetical protein